MPRRRSRPAPALAGAVAVSLSTFSTRGELIREHPTVDTDWVVPMAFGATETMTVCTGMPTGTPAEYWAGSAGKQHPGNTLKIVDPVTRETVALGELGEMCIKGRP